MSADGPLGNTGLDAYVTGDESNKSKTVLFIVREERMGGSADFAA